MINELKVDKWIDIGEGIFNDLVVGSLAYDSKTYRLFAGTENGLYIYDFDKWHNFDSESLNCPIGSLLFDDDNRILYIGTDGNGIFKHDGSSLMNIGADDDTIYYRYLLNVKERGLLLAGTNKGILAYDNQRWFEYGLRNYNVWSLAYDSNTSTLFAGTTDNGVWAISDNEWVNTGGKIRSEETFSLVYIPSQKILYAGTKIGIWKYDGFKWKQASNKLSKAPITELIYDWKRDILFAGTLYFGVWRKYNNSKWFGWGGISDYFSVESFAIDVENSILFVGASEKSIFLYKYR